MSLLQDAVGPGASGQTFANVSSISWSHTMGSGSGGLLVACLQYLSTASVAGAISSIDFNGAAMTGPTARAVRNPYRAAAQYGSTEFYQLVAPSTGAKTLTVNFDRAGIYGNSGSVSYTGANQATPFGNTNTSTGNGTSNGSPTVSSAAGNLVLDVMGGAYDNAVGDPMTGGQTSRFNGLTTTDYQGASQEAAGAASVTMGWTWAAARDWGWSGVEINAASSFLPARPLIIRQAIGGMY